MIENIKQEEVSSGSSPEEQEIFGTLCAMELSLEPSVPNLHRVGWQIFSECLPYSRNVVQNAEQGGGPWHLL